MKQKTITFIALVMFLVLAACLFSGCLGDKVVGTWDAKNSSTTITFNKDNTFTAQSGILTSSGTWEKSGSEYILYTSRGTKFGNAVFVGKDLRVSFEVGVFFTFSISEDFTKRK